MSSYINRASTEEKIKTIDSILPFLYTSDFNSFRSRLFSELPKEDEGGAKALPAARPIKVICNQQGYDEEVYIVSLFKDLLNLADPYLGDLAKVSSIRASLRKLIAIYNQCVPVECKVYPTAASLSLALLVRNETFMMAFTCASRSFEDVNPVKLVPCGLALLDENLLCAI